jgi:hypothetical protein
MKRMASILLAISLGAATNAYAQAQMTAPTGSPALKDPIQLCDKLAGTEREICLRKARENPSTAGGGIGATPGTGGAGIRAPDVDAKPDDKRGNTPPGTSRGGDAPASGAIVDPSGATKR